MYFPNKRLQQYFICFIAMVVVILYILSLVGCVSTSPGIPGIYLIKLSNNETGAEVHVGLFGLCAGIGNLSCATTLGASLLVSGNASSADAQYALPGSTSGRAADDALQPLLAVAVRVQSSAALGPGAVAAAVYVPLVIGCVFFVAAVAALLAHSALAHGPAAATAYDDDKFYEESPHCTRAWHVVGIVTTYSVAAAVAAGTASLAAQRALQFGATALPGTALSAAEAASDDSIVVAPGTALPVLQWLVVALTLAWHLLMTFVWR